MKTHNTSIAQPEFSHDNDVGKDAGEDSDAEPPLFQSARDYWLELRGKRKREARTVRLRDSTSCKLPRMRRTLPLYAYERH